MDEKRLRELAGLNEQFKGQKVLDQAQEAMIKALKLTRSDSVLGRSLSDKSLKRMLSKSHDSMVKVLNTLQDIDQSVQEDR